MLHKCDDISFLFPEISSIYGALKTSLLSINSEGIFAAEIDFGQVRQERQNFDLAGHYSRPDVTKLIINRERQSIVFIK